MRQLTDASVNVTLTRSYEPFGDPLQTTGTGTSIFAFTGEQRDGTGLVYLRARYYGSSFGRFLSRDVWEGNPFEPVSHNPWLYVANNPVNLLDPSGLIEVDEAEDADAILADLWRRYAVQIHRDWGYAIVHRLGLYRDYRISTDCVWTTGSWRTLRELQLVQESLDLISDALDGEARFRSAMRGAIIVSRWGPPRGPAFALPDPISRVTGDIVLPDYQFDHGEMYARHNIIHEFGHMWDLRSDLSLSTGLMLSLETIVCESAPGYVAGQVPGGTVCGFDIGAGREPPPGRPLEPYAGTSRLEDWAEAFAVYVYDDYYESLEYLGYLLLGPLREQYVQARINELR